MSVARKIKHDATIADLEEALPQLWRGEIIDGVMYAFPRPAMAHANAEGGVFHSLRGPFHYGHGGGPGGWWTVAEPGIRLDRAPEFSPDVAGWRWTRMPRMPRGPVSLVPDWICEVLSPSTRGYDLVTKRRFYAEIGISHLWYVDTEARALTVSRLENGKWVELGVHGESEHVRAEPFEAIEIALADWWTGLEEEPPPEG